MDAYIDRVHIFTIDCDCEVVPTTICFSHTKLFKFTPKRQNILG